MIKRLKFLGLAFICGLFLISSIISGFEAGMYIAIIGFFVGLFFIIRAEWKAEKIDREYKKTMLYKEKNKHE